MNNNGYRRVDIGQAMKQEVEAQAPGATALLKLMASEQGHTTRDVLAAFVEFVQKQSYECKVAADINTTRAEPSPAVLHTASKVLVYLREEYCTQTVGMNCQAWDAMFCRLLFEAILPNAHSCTWPRLIKTYIMDAFDTAEPYDGSTGKVVALNGSILRLLDDISSDNSNAVDELLSRADFMVVNFRDALGWTLLHHAAFHGSTTTMPIIIKHGLGINEVSYSEAQATPLHGAVQSLSVPSIKFLVANGASLTQQDGHGFAPFQLLLRTLRHSRAARTAFVDNEAPGLLQSLVAHPNDLWVSSTKSRSSYWLFESEAPLFLASTCLSSTAFEAVVYIAASSQFKERNSKEIARCLMCAISRGRVEVALCLLRHFGTMVLHRSDSREWAHGVIHDAISLAIERQCPNTILSKLLAIKEDDVILRAFFSPMPLFMAVMHGDLLSLSMLLNRGYADQSLVVIGNHNYPSWSGIDDLCPLSAACLKGDSPSLAKMVGALPGGRLVSAQCMSSKVGVSPIVCAALSMSMEVLLTLRRYMQPREFTVACNGVDLAGHKPLHVMLAQVRTLSSAGMQNHDKVTDATKMCQVLLAELSNSIGSNGDVTQLEKVRKCWHEREMSLKAQLSDAAQKEAVAKTKALVIHNEEDMGAAFERASGILAQWEDVTQRVSQPSFIANLRVFLAGKFGRSSIILTRAIVVITTKSTAVSIGSDEKADLQCFTNMATAYDKFTTDLIGGRKVSARMGPFRWKQATNLMKNLGNIRTLQDKMSWRYLSVTRLLEDWVTLVLKDAADLFGFTADGTKDSDVHDLASPLSLPLSARDIVISTGRRQVLSEVISILDSGRTKMSASAASNAFAILVGADSLPPSICSLLRMHRIFVSEASSFAISMGNGAVSRGLSLTGKDKGEGYGRDIGMLDTVASSLVSGLFAETTSGFIDGVGQSALQALCSNSCWAAATLGLQMLRASDDPNSIAQTKCVYPGTFVKYLNDVSVPSSRLVPLSPPPLEDTLGDWEELDTGSVTNISILDLVMRSRQLPVLNLLLGLQSKFDNDLTASDIASLALSKEAYKETLFTVTRSYELSGYGAPVLTCPGGVPSKGLHMTDRTADFQGTLVRRKLKELRALSAPQYSGHTMTSTDLEIHQAKELSKLLEVCLAKAKGLIESNATHLNSPTSSLLFTTDSVNPQYEGKFAGVCLTSGTNDVLMMDGTRRSLEEFSRDFSVLPLAMPAPALAGGPLCSGYHLLHAVSEYAGGAEDMIDALQAYDPDICALGIAADLSGRTAIYRAIEAGNVSVAAHMLDNVEAYDGREYNAKVLTATNQYPSDAVDIKNIFFPRVERWLKHAKTTYNLVASAHRTNSNLWKWPAPADRTLLEVLKQLASTWDVISSDTFLPHIQNLYSNHLGVMACVTGAKKVLSTLALPASKLADFKDLLDRPSPTSVKTFLGNKYTKLNSTMRMICAERDANLPMDVNRRMVTVSNQMFKLHNRTLLETFRADGSSSRSHGAQDLCNSICDGRGLPSEIFHELKVYSRTVGPSSSATAYLRNSLEEFMKLWRVEKRLIEDSAQAAAQIIEFGRLLCLARCLTCVTRVHYDPLPPNPYGFSNTRTDVTTATDTDVSASDADEGQTGRHPLERILRDIIDAEDADQHARSLLRSVRINDVRVSTTGGTTEHAQPRGSMTRLPVLDGQEIGPFDALLCTTSLVPDSDPTLRAISAAALSSFSYSAKSLDIPSERHIWCVNHEGTGKEDGEVLPPLFNDGAVTKRVDKMTSSSSKDREILLERMRKMTIRDILSCGVELENSVKTACDAIRTAVPSFASMRMNALLAPTCKDELSLRAYLEKCEAPKASDEENEENGQQSQSPSATTVDKHDVTAFISTVYNTANRLAHWLMCLESIFSHRGLYSMDVYVCLPDRLLNPLNVLALGDENDFATLKCCKSLLAVGADPIGPDASQRRPIFMAAVLGKVELISQFLFKHKEALRLAITNPKLSDEDPFRHIIWHMLMHCPAPSSDVPVSTLRRKYEDCIILLLNGGWRVEVAFKGNALSVPVGAPSAASMSCIDLVGIKQLPRALKLMLLLGAIPDSSSGKCPDVAYLSIMSPRLREDVSIIYTLMSRTGALPAPLKLNALWSPTDLLKDCKLHDDVAPVSSGSCVVTKSGELIVNALRSMLPDSGTTNTYHLCPLTRSLKSTIAAMEGSKSAPVAEHLSLTWTPLHFALAVRGSRAASMILTRFGVRDEDMRSSALVHCAAFYGNAKVVENLLTRVSATADSDEGSSSSSSPHFLSVFEPLSVETPVTPLEVSLRVGCYKTLRTLLQGESSKAATGQLGWKHFREACSKASPRITLLLLKCLCDNERSSKDDVAQALNVTSDEEGFLQDESALHLLARRGCAEADTRELIATMLEHGASRTVVDVHGLTPLQCSIAAGNGVATRLLGSSRTHSVAVLKMSFAVRTFLLRRNLHGLDLASAVKTISSYTKQKKAMESMLHQ